MRTLKRVKITGPSDKHKKVLSALEIFLSMRYINLHFTYLLTTEALQKKHLVSDLWPICKTDRPTANGILKLQIPDPRIGNVRPPAVVRYL